MLGKAIGYQPYWRGCPELLRTETIFPISLSDDITLEDSRSRKFPFLNQRSQPLGCTLSVEAKVAP
jgi:hypothetical protein